MSCRADAMMGSCAPLDPQPLWYDDLLSCLQTTIGLALQAHGWDPVQALASGWRFSDSDTPVEPVEFYHPARDELGERFCVAHPVQLRWHHPVSREEADAGIMAASAAGSHVIVAVNNFHLPFRPAYHDVHAAHLLLLHEIDVGGGVASVHDPQPPAYCGLLSRDILDTARSSLAIDDGSDPFFAGASPSWRWLEVSVNGSQPDPSLPWVLNIMGRNLEFMLKPSEGPDALSALLDTLPWRLQEYGPRALRDIYVLGWPAQAEASLHSKFLSSVAQRHGQPRLAEVARAVDHVANSWTGFRVSAAHAASFRSHTGPLNVMRHGTTLLRRWQRCLDTYEDVHDLLTDRRGLS